MKNLKIEKEIMVHWKNDPSQPLVSICCTTYNHEPYIQDALEGFLIQETDFPFEILIHDDASTDRTGDIIRGFEARYPTLIKPIYQTENQYSKGNKPGLINLNRANGKYLAFCEGDDYWIVPDKLQKQVIEMQNDASISLVIHKAKKLLNGTLYDWNESNKGDKKQNLTIKDIVQSTGQFAPTSSYLVKKQVYEKFPRWVSKMPIGDFFTEVYSQKVGRCLYLPETMSVYRQNIKGSWSSRNKFLIIQSPKAKYEYGATLLEALDRIENDFNELNAKDLAPRRAISIRTICIACIFLKDFESYKTWAAKLKQQCKMLRLVKKEDKMICSFHRIRIIFILLYYYYFAKYSSVAVKHFIRDFYSLRLKKQTTVS